MLATGEYEAVDLFSRISAGLVANGAPIDFDCIGGEGRDRRNPTL